MKQTIKPLKISEIKISDIIIGNKTKNQKVPLSLKGKPIITQTPYFEVISTVMKTSHDNICQLETIPDENSEKSIRFLQFIEDIETYICNYLQSGNLNWFNDHNITFKSFIREDKQKRVYIRWPMELTNDLFINFKKEIIDPFKIKEGQLIRFIIEISNLWINENKIGLAIIVQKAMIKDKEEVSNIETEYIFTESEEENNSDENDSIYTSFVTEQKEVDSRSKSPNEQVKPMDTKESFHQEDSQIKSHHKEHNQTNTTMNDNIRAKSFQDPRRFPHRPSHEEDPRLKPRQETPHTKATSHHPADKKTYPLDKQPSKDMLEKLKNLDKQPKQKLMNGINKKYSTEQNYHPINPYDEYDNELDFD
jgi:hypothetical protein